MESGIVVQLLLSLSAIILATQLAGVAARLLRQPRVLGELMAGVLLGPSLLNMPHWSQFVDPELLRQTIDELAELGVLLLMFSIGLEIHLNELAAIRQMALWSGVLGGIMPVLMTIPVVRFFGYSAETAIFTGVVMAATSVSISAQTLLELGHLRTKEGVGLLAAAVIDDILALLLLAVVLVAFGPDTQASATGLFWTLARLVLYLAGALAVAWLVLPRLFNWIYHQHYLTQGMVSLALLAMLVFSWAAEAAGGITAVTGAFIAGVGLSRIHERPHLEIATAVYHVSYSFLVPIFFVNVGLHADIGKITPDLVPFVLALLAAAVISKVIGSGAGALVGGFNAQESLRVGICRISRGEVGLIVASLGLTNGLLSARLFQPVFLVIFLTTILTPPLVRWAFRGYATGPGKTFTA